MRVDFNQFSMSIPAEYMYEIGSRHAETSQLTSMTNE